MRLSSAVQANPDGGSRVGHCAGHCRLLPACPHKREGRLRGQLTDGRASEEIPRPVAAREVLGLRGARRCREASQREKRNCECFLSDHVKRSFLKKFPSICRRHVRSGSTLSCKW